MRRLFVGLPIDEGAGDALMALQTGLPSARWTMIDNFHLTLAFIGEVDEAVARDVDAALSDVRHAPLTLRFSGCDFFGRKKPHAVWARVDDDGGLSALQEKVSYALRRIGVALEKRKFTPHVTLAYVRGAALDEVTRWCDQRGGFAHGPIFVDGFALYDSMVYGGERHYDRLVDYPLESSM